jgi:hypothetical protein
VACDLVRVIANAACFARGAHAYRPASEHPGAASAPNIDPRQAGVDFRGVWSIDPEQQWANVLPHASGQKTRFHSKHE